MTARSLGILVAGATFLGAAAPTLAATRHMARSPSCSARLAAIRAAWERMPASDTKNQVAAAYNQANHARQAGDQRGCLAAVAQIRLQR
ncbi:MAG TPA: hypothetical protein VHD15_01415 [Hyphomicrobiales bacterium]|nr:hypothetical protein [Hyphomicrobiales bacterium]